MQRLSARIQEKDIFDMDSTEGTLMISLIFDEPAQP